MKILDSSIGQLIVLTLALMAMFVAVKTGASYLPDKPIVKSIKSVLLAA